MMSSRARTLLLASALILFAAPSVASNLKVESELVVSGLDGPLFATAPQGDARLFVVERPGRIVVLVGGAANETPFLDISTQVGLAGEQGLLGLAFDPEYATNGRFFVLYNDLAGDSIVSRFTVSANPDVADPTETVVMTVPQPYDNHNGGTVAFGADGFLYVSFGDGGLGNDPDERSQDPADLLGKMLRIDVGVPPASGSIPVPGENYAIPEDNPFVGTPGTRDEIWAFGLRNPYRFSFDRVTGDLWIADVGQNVWEEIDFEPAGDPGGRNYGWDVMEGTRCNLTDPAPAPPCNDPSLTLPIFEYGHTAGNCSITGGFVHRGSVPAIFGDYLFGDFCTGRVWSLDPQTLVATERTAELGAAGGAFFALVGFGEDGAGENYVVLSSGSVHRIVQPPAQCGDGIDNDGDGDVDLADPGCFDAESRDEDPACNNGLDDDGDGDIDLADVHCAGRPWFARETSPTACGLGAVEPVLLLLALRYGRQRRSNRTVSVPKVPCPDSR